MLSPGRVREHDADFDVMHVQFGFDAQSAEALAGLVTELRRCGKRLVYTAHDLRNPHHAVRQAHDAHLDVLIPAADEVITLTPGAAAEIERRWGREPVVLPHPHVIELDRFRPRRKDGDRWTVGCTRRACARAWPRCRSSPPWRTSCDNCPALGCR